MITRAHRHVPDPVPALVLSGGGARAAYQVGVLKAISDMTPRGIASPFPVICGTSAGAINATAIATHAANFRTGVRGLERVWRQFRAEQVYCAGMGTLSKSALRWLTALFFGGLGTRHPDSLLDNSPLHALLTRLMRFERLRGGIASGHLRALSITASGYSSGESVVFFEGAPDLRGWRRARRVGVPVTLGIEHLMASSAIPAIFPPVRIHREYFGDGSVRQLAPLSPALHLGADRILVVGVGGELVSPSREEYDTTRPPSVAEIAGHVLDSAFLDSLEGDLERLHRVNHTVSVIPEKIREREGVTLRPVETLVISPSESLSLIAAQHAHELPRAMRFFLRGSEATESNGAVMMSYLLFEAGFCRRLINLGYADALRREREILRFLGYNPDTIAHTALIAPQDIW